MDHNRLIQEQFTWQTHQFSAWELTRNAESLNAIVDDLGLSDQDSVLDIACGTGELTCCCAGRSRFVHGIDLTHNMLAHARLQAQNGSVRTVRFVCADSERLPYPDESFSVVLCKSAFHHMPGYRSVFNEMTRCCRAGGLICLQDIAGYDTEPACSFFDQMDTLMDPSHHARLLKGTLIELFVQRDIDILKVTNLDREISVDLYRRHALQTEENLRRLEVHISDGLADPALAPFLYRKDAEPVFQDKGIRLLGRKG